MKKIILASLLTSIFMSSNVLIADDTKTQEEKPAQPTKAEEAAKSAAELLSLKPTWVSSAKNTLTIGKNINTLVTKIKDNKDEKLKTKIINAVVNHLNKMAAKIDGIEEIKTKTLEEISKKGKEIIIKPVNHFLKPLHAVQEFKVKNDTPLRILVECILLENKTIQEIIRSTGKSPFIMQFFDAKKEVVDNFFEKELKALEDTVQLSIEIKCLIEPIIKYVKA